MSNKTLCKRVQKPPCSFLLDKIQSSKILYIKRQENKFKLLRVIGSYINESCSSSGPGFHFEEKGKVKRLLKQLLRRLRNIKISVSQHYISTKSEDYWRTKSHLILPIPQYSQSQNDITVFYQLINIKEGTI